ncbi:MAG: serine/threonine protein kinase [Gemmatimonadaceae bacterium]|nr:serine/threonine protein kinase [Gemmatimonadaceae bacterium]
MTPRTASAIADPLFIAFQQALAGRYSLDREIGRGGMGIVYLAREVHLDRLVAIKLLPPELSGDQARRARFLREARLAARLSHPNIIPIHAVEELEHFVFFVMTFIDGETLEHRVRTRGPLVGSEAVRLLREVAWALSYAHGQGLIHRDVKPDNILLEVSTGRVLVADFGIAEVTGDACAAGVAGTPEFMSPEQALGDPVDARSDLYALGATAFFACSGRLPFEGGTATELLARHVTEAPPRLTSLAPSVPRTLASLVDRCLAKDPLHRPESAQWLAEELNTALEKRREIPAALRDFVKRGARLNGGGTLLASVAILPLVAVVTPMTSAQVGWMTFGFGITALPFGYFVYAAERLMDLGFTHADIGPAFRRELEQAREERSVARQARRTRLERWLSGGIRVAGVSGAAAFAVGSTGLVSGSVADAGVLSMVIAALGALGLFALRGRHEDVETSMWSKVWLGRIGRAAFAVAGTLLGDRARTTTMTHRATELALGMAAEQLFASLPADTRHALGDVPALVQRLQRDAQRLRQQRDDLQQALAEAHDATAPAHTDLRATCDQVQVRLGESMTALETIRLNLLRLHAGSATVEGLTTHLGMAAELSADVQRLIAAHAEVEQSLLAPRPALTPA